MRSKGLQRARLAELGRVAPPDLGDAGKPSASTLRRMAARAVGALPRRTGRSARRATAPRARARRSRRTDRARAAPAKSNCGRAVLQHVEQAPGARGRRSAAWRAPSAPRCCAPLNLPATIRMIAHRRRAAGVPLAALDQAELGGELGAQLLREHAPLHLARPRLSARSPSANGPNEMRISRLTVRPRCSARRFTSRFLPSRKAERQPDDWRLARGRSALRPGRNARRRS